MIVIVVVRWYLRRLVQSTAAKGKAVGRCLAARGSKKPADATSRDGESNSSVIPYGTTLTVLRHSDAQTKRVDGPPRRLRGRSGTGWRLSKSLAEAASAGTEDCRRHGTASDPAGMLGERPFSSGFHDLDASALRLGKCNYPGPMQRGRKTARSCATVNVQPASSPTPRPGRRMLKMDATVASHRPARIRLHEITTRVVLVRLRPHRRE